MCSKLLSGNGSRYLSPVGIGLEPAVAIAAIRGRKTVRFKFG